MGMGAQCYDYFILFEKLTICLSIVHACGGEDKCMGFRSCVVSGCSSDVGSGEQSPRALQYHLSRWTRMHSSTPHTLHTSLFHTKTITSVT